MTVREFLDRQGSSPFAKWFGGLDTTAAAKVTTAQARWKDYKRRKSQEK